MNSGTSTSSSQKAALISTILSLGSVVLSASPILVAAEPEVFILSVLPVLSELISGLFADRSLSFSNCCRFTSRFSFALLSSMPGVWPGVGLMSDPPRSDCSLLSNCCRSSSSSFDSCCESNCFRSSCNSLFAPFAPFAPFAGRSGNCSSFSSRPGDCVC